MLLGYDYLRFYFMESTLQDKSLTYTEARETIGAHGNEDILGFKVIENPHFPFSVLKYH